MADRWYTCHLTNRSCYSHDPPLRHWGVGHLSWQLWTKANSRSSWMPLILAQSLEPFQTRDQMLRCPFPGLVISWMIAIFLSRRPHTLPPFLCSHHSVICDMPSGPGCVFSLASWGSFMHIFPYTFLAVMLLCCLFPKHLLDVPGHVRMHLHSSTYEH